MCWRRATASTLLGRLHSKQLGLAKRAKWCEHAAFVAYWAAVVTPVLTAAVAAGVMKVSGWSSFVADHLPGAVGVGWTAVATIVTSLLLRAASHLFTQRAGAATTEQERVAAEFENSLDTVVQSLPVPEAVKLLAQYDGSGERLKRLVGFDVPSPQQLARLEQERAELLQVADRLLTALRGSGMPWPALAQSIAPVQPLLNKFHGELPAAAALAPPDLTDKLLDMLSPAKPARSTLLAAPATAPVPRGRVSRKATPSPIRGLSRSASIDAAAQSGAAAAAALEGSPEHQAHSADRTRKRK